MGGDCFTSRFKRALQLKVTIRVKTTEMNSFFLNCKLLRPVSERRGFSENSEFNELEFRGNSGLGFQKAGSVQLTRVTYTVKLT